MKITVLGSGGWGTALALLLLENGNDVTLWSYTEEESTVLRETREETGLTLTDFRYRGLVPFVSDQAPTEYMHLFTASAWTGTAHPCDEGELAWIKKAALRSLPMWAGDRIFLDLLEAGGPFFSLKLQYQGEKLAGAWLDGRPLTV